MLLIATAAFIMIFATYFQMWKCSQTLKIINEAGGANFVCGWAVSVCEILKDEGVIQPVHTKLPEFTVG